MNKAYFFLAALMILLGAGLIFLPERNHPEEASPRELLGELRNPSLFISTDKVAEMIIDKDPRLLLVDVRDMYDYLEFSLPGAHSIPLEEILMYNWVDSLAFDDSQIVLFSNADIRAEQAWLLMARKKVRNLHVMKGGLNRWFETIIQPKKPSAIAPDEEFDLYEFRKGASIYFTGGTDAVEVESGAEPVIVNRRKKTNVVEGGC